MKYSLYMDNGAEWEKLLKKEWKISRDLDVLEVEDGYILPLVDLKHDGFFAGGCTDKDFNFLAGLIRSNPDNPSRPGFYGCGQSYIPTGEIDDRRESVVFGGGLWAIILGICYWIV